MILLMHFCRQQGISSVETNRSPRAGEASTPVKTATSRNRRASHERGPGAAGESADGPMLPCPLGFQWRREVVIMSYTLMNTRAAPQRVNPDGQEFLALYQEHLASIYRFVYNKVGSREEAEDLTSQVFMKAVRYLDYEHNAQNMHSWLFQVARTTIADYWRAFYRAPTSSLEVLLEVGWEGPTEDVNRGNGSAAERVRRILQDIPGRYREVLTCRFLLDLSLRETAERMGVSIANVKTLQFRALKHAAGLNTSGE